MALERAILTRQHHPQCNEGKDEEMLRYLLHLSITVRMMEQSSTNATACTTHQTPCAMHHASSTMYLIVRHSSSLKQQHRGAMREGCGQRATGSAATHYDEVEGSTFGEGGRIPDVRVCNVPVLSCVEAINGRNLSVSGLLRMHIATYDDETDATRLAAS